MSYSPKLTPCRDENEGAKDRLRYVELGLPEQWIEQRLNSKGSWIAPDEYFWTPDPYFEVMESMSPQLLQQIRAATGGSFHDLKLIEQCELLGLTYARYDPALMVAEYPELTKLLNGKVEAFALHYFNEIGWQGDCLEGSAFHFISQLIIKLCQKEGLYCHGTWYAERHVKENYSCAFLENGFCQRNEVSKNELAALTQLIATIGEDMLEGIYSEWCLDHRAALVNRGVSLPRVANSSTFSFETLLLTWRGFGFNNWVELCRLQLLGYGGKGGWPDLTLWKDGQLRFVEVKQASDKFTERQPSWVRNFARPMGLNVEVMHIIKRLKTVTPK
jgi:hypothetical protein